MPRSPRQRLAEAQRMLLDALLDGGPPPPGFDAERLRVAAEALREKHSRAVGKRRPGALVRLVD